MTFGNYIYQDNTAESRKAAIDQLISTSDKLEAGHLKAVETASQLQNAIAQLDMNEAEDGFKQELLGDLQTVIDDNTKYDNMYYALDDIVKMSGKIMSDPRVLGRLRAQQQYKAYQEILDKRTDINEDKKDWMRDLNKYHYKDKVDENGKIIGGTEWKPTKTIGKDFDYGSLLIKAIHQIAAKRIRSGEVIEYLDINGNPVDISTNPNGVASAWIKKEDGSYKEQLKAKDIQDALDTLIATTPGALTGLQEDYDFALWYHDKHKNDNGYSDPYGITINGVPLSPDDYKKSRFKQGIDAAAYLNIKTTTDQEIINPRLLDRDGYGNRSGNGVSEYSNPVLSISSLGVPTQQTLTLDSDQKKDMNASIDIVKSIGNEILGKEFVFDEKQPDISFNNAIQGILTKMYDKKISQDEANAAIKIITRAQEDYNMNKRNNEALRDSYVMGLTGKEAKQFDDDYAFITNLNSGNLDYTNKTYKEYVDLFNDAFKSKNDKGEIILLDSRSFTFNPEHSSKMQQWCKDNDIDLKEYGITFSGDTMIVPRNLQAVSVVGRMLSENPIYKTGNTYTYYTKKPGVNNFSGLGRGTLIETYNQEAAGQYDTGYSLRKLGDYVEKVSNRTDKVINKRLENGIEVVSASYLLPNTDWTNVGEGIDVSDAKVIYDDTLKRIINLGQDLAQFKVFGFGEKDKNRNGNLVPISDGATRRKMNDDFNLAKQKGALQISPMIHNHEGVGAYITYPIYEDGKETGKFQNIFVADLNQSEASERWKNNPDVIAHMQIGQINEVPGQSRYILRNSEFPSIGNITATSIKDNAINDKVSINLNGRQFYVNKTQARQLMSYGIQLENFAKLYKLGEIENERLNNVLLKISMYIGDVSGLAYTQIYNGLINDFSNL